MREPTKKAPFQKALYCSGAFTRKSKATPRTIRPISMAATGRYRVSNTGASAIGKATSSTPTPSTSQVSLASQKGPMLATMVSFCPLSPSGSSRPTPRS